MRLHWTLYTTPQVPENEASARRACGLVREGLRSGPGTGHLDFTGCTVRTCFAAGARQIADKSAPTESEKSRTSEASPGPHTQRASARRAWDLSAKGCEAALEQATLILPGAPCVPVLLPVPGSSRTSPLLHSKQIADKRSVARSAAEFPLSGLHNLRTELEREVTHNAPTASSTAPESATDARHCPTPARC